ncbi:MAG: beta-lactamase family protein [Chloroflexales bacterium]|nr:beta-lactamase family protein [Chloroflexales bacterium]
MADTFGALTSDEATARAERLAQGHVVAYGQPLPVAELSGFLGGSGGVVSTAADMAHYLAMQAGGGQYKGRALVTREHLALTHTPPAGGLSQYGMGWFALEEHGTPTIQHNGILSTAYAEAVLLPERGYGFVLLYDEYSLASAALAFPALKAGMIALLDGQPPREGGLTVPVLGGIFAVLTLVSAGLALRSLVRLPVWATRAEGRPRWRQWLGALGPLTPALLLLALPRLLATGSDRYFGFVMLARAMPEIIIPLALVSATGAITAVLRLRFVVRRHGS